MESRDRLEKWKIIFETRFSPPLHKLGVFKGVELWVMRDDLNHTLIQGNKLRKLKYGTLEALSQNHSSLITFGGAYSNHLLAVSAVAQELKMSALAFVRGDELKNKKTQWSSTLKNASRLGMNLEFLTRKEYREKEKSTRAQKVLSKQESYWLIPEGGTDGFALKGIVELVDDLSSKAVKFDHIICPCGTGGTFAGLIEGVFQNDLSSQVIGVQVLHASAQIENEVEQLCKNHKHVRWLIKKGYEFGGYAKITDELIEFGRDFYKNYGIPLDRVYNIKSFYSAFHMINAGKFTSGSRALLVHTGGLQGGWIK